MSISKQIQNFCGDRGSEFENIRQALQKYAGDNSPESQMRKEFENAISGIERGRGIVKQIIGSFPGVKPARTLAEISGQRAICREVQRLNRQAQTFGFPDFESLQNAIADAQWRAELEEERERKLEEIRNAKLKPIVPNITIEIHLHEKEAE